MEIAAISVGGSGIVYGVLRYFLEGSSDPYSSVSRHPWEPAARDVHLLLAPLLVLGLALIWNGHIRPKFVAGAKKRRRSGVALMLLSLPMIFTGYLLQIAIDDFWRQFWIWSHGITSSIFLLAFAVHWRFRRELRDP